MRKLQFGIGDYFIGVNITFAMQAVAISVDIPSF